MTMLAPGADVRGYPDVVVIHAAGEHLKEWTWGCHEGGDQAWITTIDDTVAHETF